MPSRRILLTFGLFWSAITCLFLGFLIFGIANQWRARSFATAPGSVDSVKEVASRGSKSTTYSVEISYHFLAQGHTYIGNRVRYAQGSSSDSWASDMVHRFPAGSHPTVYYDPSNPGDSVLIVGLQGEDLFLAMFLTPFTLVMLAIWAAFVNTFLPARGFMGLKLLEDGTTTRIRPSGWMALGAAALALGLGAFVSIFVIGFGFGGFHPPMRVATVAWAIVLAIAGALGISKWLRIRSGALDVVLNDLERTLAAPSGVIVPYKEISDVQVVTTTQHNSKGQDTHTYEVWLHYLHGDGTHSLKLEKWVEQKDQADRFAAWLAERLRVKVRGVKTADNQPAAAV